MSTKSTNTQNEQNISPNTQNAPKSKEKKSSFTKGVLEQLELVIIFFAIMIVIFSFVCKTCVVDGDSMEHTLSHSERVLIWDAFYSPDYGDIVVIHDNDELRKPVVKRIIGLPGDTVTVEHFSNFMKVTITHSDGSTEVLDEDYINYNDGFVATYSPKETYEVQDGQVFVMGDNRLNSLDSRKLGCYDSRQILGKVILRISPINKFGGVS